MPYDLINIYVKPLHKKQARFGSMNLFMIVARWYFGIFILFLFVFFVFVVNHITVVFLLCACMLLRSVKVAKFTLSGKSLLIRFNVSLHCILYIYFPISMFGSEYGS